VTRKPRSKRPAEGRFTPETEANGVKVKATPRADIVTYRQLALADDRNPWDRQPDEPLLAHGWFCMYRDVPPQDRSVVSIAQMIDRTTSYVYKISARDRWRDRAAAWDTEELRRWVLRQDAQRRRSINKHVRLSDAMLDKALARVAALDPETISLRDLSVFIDVAAKIGRAALGLDAPAILAATQINLPTAKAEGSDEQRAAQEEAAETHTRVLRSLASMAERMTEEQRQLAAAAWLPPAASEVLEGEVVPDGAQALVDR
jgi:hypothetical protein